MVTRLGLYGGSRGLYGSFAGKTEQVLPTVDYIYTAIRRQGRVFQRKVVN